MIDWNLFKPLREQVKAERLQREAAAENFRRRLKAFRRQNPQLDGRPVEPERKELE
jgi:hypothetical protein